jgi:hypothetical protein
MNEELEFTPEEEAWLDSRDEIARKARERRPTDKDPPRKPTEAAGPSCELPDVDSEPLR